MQCCSSRKSSTRSRWRKYTTGSSILTWTPSKLLFWRRSPRTCPTSSTKRWPSSYMETHVVHRLWREARREGLQKRLCVARWVKPSHTAPHSRNEAHKLDWPLFYSIPWIGIIQLLRNHATGLFLFFIPRAPRSGARRAPTHANTFVLALQSHPWASWIQSHAGKSLIFNVRYPLRRCRSAPGDINAQKQNSCIAITESKRKILIPFIDK